MESLDDFNRIYMMYSGFVRSVLFRIVGSNLLDDAVQECFVKVWRNKDSFNKESSVKTWIYRVAVNTALDVLRKNKKPELLIEEKVTQLEGNFLAVEVQKILLEMPIEYRVAVTAVIFEEMTTREASDALDIPEGTVKSRVNRGREILKTSLREKGYEYE